MENATIDSIIDSVDSIVIVHASTKYMILNHLDMLFYCSEFTSIDGIKEFFKESYNSIKIFRNTKNRFKKIKKYFDEKNIYVIYDEKGTFINFGSKLRDNNHDGIINDSGLSAIFRKGYNNKNSKYTLAIIGGRWGDCHAIATQEIIEYFEKADRERFKELGFNFPINLNLIFPLNLIYNSIDTMENLEKEKVIETFNGMYLGKLKDFNYQLFFNGNLEKENNIDYNKKIKLNIIRSLF